MENPPNLAYESNGSKRQGMDGDPNRTRGIDALTSAFRKVVADGEELLKATASYSAEGLAVARDRFQSNLQEAKVKMKETQVVVKDKATYAANATQEYVRENPWKAVAIVGTVGMVLGLLMSQRGDNNRSSIE
ncbi:MAG: DUF883 domain-containing protein [Burkholderiales bacterium]|nr:DUF883 domain-containing protein [Burkholderiales bacterium]